MIMLEENTNTVLNFNDALKALESISNEKFTTDAWVPSLNRNIKIKELTAKQQRSMIESIIDSTTTNKHTFSKVFSDIISSNSLEDKNIIDGFTVADKASLMFAFRLQLSNSIKIETEEDPKSEKEIIITPIIEKFLTYNHPEKETITFSKNSIHIETELNIPTIKNEVDFDSFIYNKKNKNLTEIDDVKQIISEAFIGETAKYVSDVVINSVSINYKDMTVAQKIQVIEKLPAALVKNILQKIISWKNELDAIYTVKVDDFTKILDMDGLLFLSN